MQKNLIIIYLLMYVFNQSVYAQNKTAVDKKPTIENNSSYSLYKTEIYKRFSNDAWEQNLTLLSQRALMQEYIKMVGISNHLNHMHMQRKQRIEGLLAAYTALKLQNKTGQ